MNPLLRGATNYFHRERLAALVVKWGYPRKIEEVEIRDGYWVYDARGDGIMWFTWVDEEEAKGILCVHGIGSPEARERGIVLTPWVVNAIEVIAGLMGATRVYSALPTVPELADKSKVFPIKAMRRYLRSLGFAEEDEIGPYIDLKV